MVLCVICINGVANVSNATVESVHHVSYELCPRTGVFPARTLPGLPGLPGNTLPHSHMRRHIGCFCKQAHGGDVVAIVGVGVYEFGLKIIRPNWKLDYCLLIVCGLVRRESRAKGEMEEETAWPLCGIETMTAFD